MKELSNEEIKRVEDLQKVWEYLYANKVYELCDIISYEIGTIKGTI